MGNQNKKSFFFQIGSPRAFFFFACAPLPFLNMGRDLAGDPTLSPSPTFTPLPIGRRCTSLSNQPLPQSSLSRPPRRPIRPARERGRRAISRYPFVLRIAMVNAAKWPFEKVRSIVMVEGEPNGPRREVLEDILQA